MSLCSLEEEDYLQKVRCVLTGGREEEGHVRWHPLSVPVFIRGTLCVNWGEERCL